MKWALASLLATVMLAGTPALLRAQELAASPTVAAPTATMPAAPAQAAFELTIEAPDEIRELLQRHLELLRYRELTDLSDSELARLLTAAEQNARELVATLGYFSPDIRFEQQAPSSGASTRLLKLRVVPGEPTVVGDVKVELKGPIATDPAASRQRQQIEDNWSLRPGMRFTQARWTTAKQQALRQLTSRRYPTGQLSATLADIDPVTRRARLNITLDSGPAYQLGGLVISGLERFDAALVTRLARLAPGRSWWQHSNAWRTADFSIRPLSRSTPRATRLPRQCWCSCARRVCKNWCSALAPAPTAALACRLNTRTTKCRASAGAPSAS
jgi:translocation and assembly module TamA